MDEDELTLLMTHFKHWHGKGNLVEVAVREGRQVILIFPRFLICNRERCRLMFDSGVFEKMVDETTDAALVSADREVVLETCLENVSPKNQAVLTAFYSHGQSVEEIAETVNRGQSAVKVLLMRLRRSLPRR